MVELDQFKYTLSTYDETLKEVKDSLDLENKERRITELDKSMEEPGFWDDRSARPRRSVRRKISKIPWMATSTLNSSMRISRS